MSDTLKSFIDSCIAATGEKGVAVAGMIRSNLPAAIRSIVLNDYTNINYLLSDILGDTVTDAAAGLDKVKAIKEAERQAIIAKGTLVGLTDKFDAYAQKIRAIQSYVDLTYSGVMPNFILDPEPTGSTIVYMKPVSTGLADGTSWDNAMSDFVTAHTSLTGTKNVIYMEEGVYPVTGVITLYATAKIYGGFKTSDHSWSQRNSFINRTILDAQLGSLRVTGSGTSTTNQRVDGLTIINARNTAASPFHNLNYSKNLIAQDCVNSASAYGGGFQLIYNSENIIAINCQAAYGGGGVDIFNTKNIIMINCSSIVQAGGIHNCSGCTNILFLNNKCSNGLGGGATNLSNCSSAKIINCSSLGNGAATYGDNTCKNFLIINNYSSSGSTVYGPNNCQNYTIVNNTTGSSGVVSMFGGSSLPLANKLYNFVCLNNKTSSGSIMGFYLGSANLYYKLYNCRADTAITFAVNAATYADIQNFALVQNDNSNTKFSNMGTYPTVGTLPYENSIINQKYIDGLYGDFNIPLDSALAGAGYWEDGFSFAWDIDGKPRTSTHCSIGCYEPNWE